uniref:Thaumatin-like protein n=1 Tax=Peronospora matthiolae TaxID=2874970 RepID=A0AAV1U7K3_9STRA
MVRHLALTGVFASAALSSASATSTVTFTNKCSVDVDFYTRLASVYTDEHVVIASGAALVKQIEKGFEGHFRNGTNDAATLVEFATKGDLDLIWFDISIIPSRMKPGFEFCKSLEECKLHSESGIGFNTPVQVTPLSNTNGENCRELTCLADACVDAYNYPQDDTKTHSCPFGTDLVVTFCPSEDVTQDDVGDVTQDDVGDVTQDDVGDVTQDDVGDVTQDDATQEDGTSGSQSTTHEIVAPEDSQTQGEVPSGNAGNAYVQDDSVKGDSAKTGVKPEEMPVPEVVKPDEKPVPQEVQQPQPQPPAPVVASEVVAQPPQPQPQPPAPVVASEVVAQPPQSQPQPPAPVVAPEVPVEPNHCV